MRTILISLVIAIAVLFSDKSTAQTVLDGVYVKEHVPTRKVIPYQHLREADVMWSKRIWRIVDLTEKINLPLRYPYSKETKDRRSLIDVIHDAALEGTLTAYKGVNEGGDDEFSFPLTQAEVSQVGVTTQVIEVQDPNTFEVTRKTISDPLKRDNVVQYKIKEDWFFDKQRSVMEVRIIGIAPLIKDFAESGEFRAMRELYWIYFPEARKIFVNQPVFNRYNDSERLSLDDVFAKRIFSSYIIKESNVYNRSIQGYKQNTLDQLLEAEKIKQDIFNMEHDLWEF